MKTTTIPYTRYEFPFVNPYNCAAQHFYFPVANSRIQHLPPSPTAVERQKLRKNKGHYGTGLKITKLNEKSQKKKLHPIERVVIFGCLNEKKNNKSTKC